MKRILILPLILMTLLILTACQSTEFTPDTPVIEKTVGDIVFQLRYVTEQESRKRFGDDYNPYYNYPGKLPRKQFFVFDTTITTMSSEVEIKLRDITISLDDRSESRARSRRTLDIDWQPYYDSDFEQAQKKANMKKTMSGDTIIVTPDQPFKAWIVFLPSISSDFLQNIFLVPKDGPANALIRIPAKTDSGDEGIVEIEMNMGEMAGTAAQEEATPSNTGIFEES
ncbi:MULTISPECIES: hypothetical protein [unclassified Oceanispirochaeta]|uniref:hypothetical protein n=1 Tax=unclassified Oceanispirochaeta TaxID=2635722 RepID=UPI000E08E109|nr:MULTISPECIES: hypothetical protein [unclassified Oceanispirochaeta]MBF9018068.1 hypothetical protein [Oceanispirochaeta sp. M2]NPD73851.1 hypothetical protein [Oceanispirochaeta sp. M1]RDG30313.1 hypothetical protein DV872_17285 [Oceanispirochaeta sp. M1]